MMTSILDLPEEMLLLIFSYLPLTELAAVSHVNEKFFGILNLEICKRGLDLERSYFLNYTEYKCFFYKNSISSKLSHLLMNGLWHYKLPVQIINCQNLRVLHIMDVPLSFSQLFKIITSFSLIYDFSFVFPNDISETKMENLMKSTHNWESIRKLEYSTHCFFVSSVILQLTSNLEILSITSTDSGKAAPLKINNRLKKWAFINSKFLKEFNLYVNDDVSYLDYNAIQGLVTDEAMRDLSVLNIFIKADLLINSILFEHALNRGAIRRQEVLRLGMSLRLPIESMYWDEGCTYPQLKEFVVTGDFAYPISNYIKSQIMPSLRSFHFFPKVSPTLDFEMLADEFPYLEKFSYSCFDHLQHLEPKKVIAGVSRLSSLTHLSVPPCIFLVSYRSNDNEDSLKPLQFKKQRKSLMPNFTPQMASFNSILDKCRSIRTLEIATFQHIPRSHTNCHIDLLPEGQSICHIKKLINLTRLTLEDIPIYNSFFNSLAEGCTMLEFIRIKNLGKSINCEYKLSLTKAIPKMHYLHSFRIEQNSLLPIGDLLSSLSKCHKLERVFIKTAFNDRKKLDSNSIISFLLNNPKLIFVWLQLGSVTKNQLKYINDYVAKKKCNHLYYQVISTNVSSDRIYRVPVTHLKEMVHYIPWIWNTKIS